MNIINNLSHWTPKRFQVVFKKLFNKKNLFLYFLINILLQTEYKNLNFNKYVKNLFRD